ncbi:MAG TPA: ATP-binding protein [Paraburkholderia sp.]|uniref:AAA family ATPase n=1 Tax=Paraburkholderia sp. TaxID=1926495 RepID=UPI002B473C94|nr:ATP-binding protein [Paraburkholderia sp.]HKR46613.1 ATP-binding protein [Paraburkholderia sp.]
MTQCLPDIQQVPEQASKMEPVIELWSLRFLVKLELHRYLVKHCGWASDLVANALALPDLRRTSAIRSRSSAERLQVGLDEEEDGEATDSTFDTQEALALLRTRLALAEADAAAGQPPAVVARNVERLQALVGLSDTEARILTFAVLVHTDRVLDKMSDWIGDLTSAGLYYALGAVLGIDEKAVCRALAPQGTLARSGLLSVDRKQRWALAAKLDLLSGEFADSIVSDDVDTLDLLRGMVTVAVPPRLALDDYSHIEQQVELIRTYLERASRTQKRGVNVLVHGSPGTGKTQLARVLAHAMQLSLYEVTGENAEGDAVPGELRLRAFRATQAFFAARPALIVFDEAEDIFSGCGPGERSVAQSHKAWLNRALEENPVPTLWLSNSISGIDPAFVRRFDMVLNIPVPPARVRSRIISRACESRVPEAIVQRLSAHPALTPGVVARAAHVLQDVADDWTPQRFGDALERLVSDTLEAQGHLPLGAHSASQVTGRFDPRFVNADANLAALAQGIAGSRSARLCLYGPPGTGKTAFGTWLAEELQCPIHVRCASDMISPYVGETEQNIAQVFREATRERALLLIDEADSFLRERATSQHSWEVTAVNEMLTQIESYDGVLVMSTNLFGSLDEAALRRFDVKLRFGYLKLDQAATFFAQRCIALGLGEPGADCETVLARLASLTPGDFAAVIRRHRFSPIRSATELAEALEKECATRQRASTPIGFLR